MVFFAVTHSATVNSPEIQMSPISLTIALNFCAFNSADFRNLIEEFRRRENENGNEEETDSLHSSLFIHKISAFLTPHKSERFTSKFTRNRKEQQQHQNSSHFSLVDLKSIKHDETFLFGSDQYDYEDFINQLDFITRAQY
jgi:hypothetical protein